MANILDEILKLTNPEPVLKDPENEFDQDSSAKLVEKDDESGIAVSQEGSKLRRKTVGLLCESDRKYAGKKLSRKDWMADSDSDDDGDDEDDEEEEDDELSEDVEMNSSLKEDGDFNLSDESLDSNQDGENDDDDDDDDIERFKSKINSSIDKPGFTFTDDGDYSKYGGDDDDDDDDQEEEEDSDSESGGENDDDDEDAEEEEEEEEDNEDEGGIQKFSASGQDEIAKGKAASQQLSLWDTLLEGRIKLQKAVSLINQLPQPNEWTEFKQETSDFETEAKKTQTVFKHLLDSLVHLQNVLLAQNSDTAGLIDNPQKTESTPIKPANVDDDDEEIPSDSDEEVAANETPAKSAVKVEKRKIKMEEYPGLLKKRFENFHSYRDTTIQRWYDKTRLAGGKVKGKSFSAFDQSALVQIKQILADKPRLIRRTQMKRSVYRVLGKTPKREDPEIVPSESGEPEEMETISMVDKNDYDEEIFDDDDFYHQLLRELIQKKTADINDPIAATRQWLQIQRLRSKKKRNIDPKASKDRKIKYTVHKKLVNFMTPIDDCEWSHEARDDLFKSLFGKRHMNSSVS